MLILTLTGGPPALGLQHGQGAKTHILRSITFYQGLFLQKSNMDWETVRSFALKYQPYLETAFPQYVSEIRGVAEGAGVAYEDILALNVRTEIAFGAFSDGCTALSWKRGEKSLLAQNWDWDVK
jgi:isopenicillin-N N-acyltransferase-like protein